MSLLLYLYFLDSVLFEYSSSSSSQEFFSTFWNLEEPFKNQLISVLFWGPKNLVNIGTQQGGGKGHGLPLYTQRGKKMCTLGGRGADGQSQHVHLRGGVETNNLKP